MTTKELTRVKRLEREVQTLRSLLVSFIYTDPEGQYRPEFVRQMKTAASKVPTHRFTTPSSFLSDLETV